MRSITGTSLIRASILMICCAGFTVLATAVEPLPDPESSEFLEIISTSLGPLERNNGVLESFRVNLVAPTVVIDIDNHANMLHAGLSARRDIAELNIYTNRLKIRGGLWMPQTEVTIHARTIEWIDPVPGTWDVAYLRTTPYALTERPAGTNGTDGADGLPAGGVNLFVQSWVEHQAAPFARLILTGGDGQPAGLGRDGDDGNDMDTYNGDPALPPLDEFPVNIVWLYQLSAGFSRITLFGEQAFPTDGEDAVAAGKPGEGGAGGVLTTSLTNAAVALVTGGLPGAMGLPTTGGAAGQPVTSHHARYTLETQRYTVVASHATAVGADAVPPTPIRSIGPEGSIEPTDDEAAWFHPRVLPAIDRYTEALVEAGGVSQAIYWIEAYLTPFAEFKTGEAWAALSAGERLSLEQTTDRLQERLATLTTPAAAKAWKEYR